MKLTLALLAISVLAFRSSSGHASSPAPSSMASSSPPSTAPAQSSAPFTALRPRYLTSLARARAWLDELRVDPIRLRESGIKGKKKLVELLDAYYRLWQIAPRDGRADLLRRIKDAVAVTYDDRYHDMLSVDDEAFKQESTSYLRAALLMERLGLDTERYRREIRKVKPRLDAHLVRRGPHQKRAFHWYYAHFGLEEPVTLSGGLEGGAISRAREPAALSNGEVYELTHEVFVLYQLGELRDVDPFGPREKAYLKEALRYQLGRQIAQRNCDLAAEILTCLHYLRMDDAPDSREGIAWLLESQNADGSWGSYDRERARLGDLVKQGFYLHTTMVALGALTSSFDLPMAPR